MADVELTVIGETRAVETAYGQVRGTRDGSVASFRGIPFAGSCAGFARFRPPRPPAAWTGVRDAVVFADACPQLPQMPEWNIPVAAWNLRAGSSEDCLHLNVWTPDVAGASRPVFVWIHGGGMEFGAGSQAWFDGARLAARADAVVVTINYRLGALGWLYLGDEEESEPVLGNAGLHDQILALRWVNENIAAFGGDPERVTVGGRSAGAITVNSLLAAPEAAGLFSQAAVMSGAAETDSPAQATAFTETLFHELGLEWAERSKLWHLAAADLVGATRRALAHKPVDIHRSVARCLPLVGGVTLPRPPHEAVAYGSCRDVTLLITSTAHEGGLAPLVLAGEGDDAVVRKLVEAVAELDEGAARKIVASYRELGGDWDRSTLYHQIATEMRLGVPSQRLAEAQVGAGGTAYLGVFAHRSPVREKGAFHGIDVGFIFDTLDLPGMAELSGSGPNVRALRDAVMESWTAFLWRGDPSCDAIAWSTFSRERPEPMLIDVTSHHAPAELGEARKAWNGVL